MEGYELKNSNKFSVHTLIISENFKKEDFQIFLRKKKSRVPEYFLNLGVFIDVSAIKHSDFFEEYIVDIFDTLKSEGFIISGVSGSKNSKKEFLNSFGVATFGSYSDSAKKEVKVIEKEVIVEKIVEVEKKIEKNNDNNLGLMRHDGIVRGGQSIYAKGKHLLVIGDVKPNAEIVADGDIIVIGSLNGKAVAGVNGRIESTISATSFKPSMISIGGNYRSFDENSDQYGENIRLLIKEEKLIIESF